MTPKEKMTKAVDEGFEWLFARIAMVLGETDRPSYETRAAATEARRAAWQAKEAFRRFEAVARGADPDEDLRQATLPHTSTTQAELDARDARDAEAGKAKLDTKEAEEPSSDAFGDIPDGYAVDQETSDAQQALEAQLAELGCMEDTIISYVVRTDAGLQAVVGAEPADNAEGVWSISREFDRVMAVLKGLAPGCGPLAVRAALCGLEETPPAEDPGVMARLEAFDALVKAINEGLSKRGCDAHVDLTKPVGTGLNGGLSIAIDGGARGEFRGDARIILRILEGLGDDATPEATWEALRVSDLFGDDQAGDRACETCDLEVECAKRDWLCGQDTTLPKWVAKSNGSEDPGQAEDKPELPGRPVGEAPKKRRAKKTKQAQQIELSGPPAGYDDSRFTGD